MVLLFVPADSLCACSPDVGLFPPVKSSLMQRTFEGFKGFFFFSFVPQDAEKVKTVVREVEEALQLLQERVRCRLSDCLLRE